MDDLTIKFLLIFLIICLVGIILIDLTIIRDLRGKIEEQQKQIEELKDKLRGK